MNKQYKVDFDKYKVLPEVMKQMNSGEITTAELERLNSWKELVEEKGYEELEKQAGWNDIKEKDGKYNGYRSSLLGSLGKRIIYEVTEQQGEKTIVIVAVVKVDTKYYGEQ